MNLVCRRVSCVLQNMCMRHRLTLCLCSWANSRLSALTSAVLSRSAVLRLNRMVRVLGNLVTLVTIILQAREVPV